MVSLLLELFIWALGGTEVADPVRDLFLYVPEAVLRRQAHRLGLRVVGLHKSQMVTELARVIPPDELEKLLDEHRYAGRGTIHWFRPTLQGEPQTLSPNELKSRLARACEADPFVRDLRPPLSERPQVVNAKVLSPTKIIIQFAHEELRTRLIEYEIREEPETVFSRMVVRVGSIYFECRANRDKSLAMAMDMSEVFGFDDAGALILDDQMIGQLIDALQGVLISAKHKHQAGDYDTTEVVVSPQVGDLRLSSQYLGGLASEPGRRKRVSFPFPPGSAQRITVEIYTRTGTLWFRSYVNEQVIDYVFSKVRDIARI